MPPKESQHWKALSTIWAIKAPKTNACQGSAVFTGTLTSSYKLTQTNALQRIAVLKSTLPNMRHKCFQTNARQRGATKAPSPVGPFAPKKCLHRIAVWAKNAPNLKFAEEVQSSKAPSLVVTNSPIEMPPKESQHWKALSTIWAIKAPKTNACQGSAVFTGTLTSSYKLTQTNALQRIAVLKSTLPNMRHKCFQTNARQRGATKAPSPVGPFAPKKCLHRIAVLKSLPSMSQKCTQPKIRRRGAVFKGTLTCSHKLTHRNATQRIAALKGTLHNMSHKCTRTNTSQRSAVWVTNSPKEMPSKESIVKGTFPIWATNAPNLTLARKMQSPKAPSPMWVTNSPKEMLGKKLLIEVLDVEVLDVEVLDVEVLDVKLLDVEVL